MIIGLAGKKSSGKDTVGKIIQYLTAYGEYKNFDTFLQSLEEGNTCNNPWKIKKFASKVKQVLSILTGIPIEDFEKEEVKNSYLGEEWNRFRPIGYFDTETIATKLFGSKEAAEKYSRCNSRNKERGAIQEVITVRQAMQLVGTDLFRDKFHSQTWVNALFSDYIEDFFGKNIFKPKDEDFRYPNWIITDCRFENEIKAIKDRNGIIIRVERDTELRFPKLWKEFTDNNSKHEEWEGFLKNKSLYDTIYHESEVALDNYDKFDYTIDNSKTIEDLIIEVKNILSKENF